MSDYKRILTIQDISCVGQCSLTVALPIISACGLETAILPSAVLSTHTGGSFEGFTFHDLTQDMPKIKEHWEKMGLDFDCLYTGYLGSIEQMDYVRQIIDSVLTAGAPVIVDPAMGDFGKLYTGFDDRFAKEMAKLCGHADIILPNLTEAAFMTGMAYKEGIHEEEYVDALLERLAKLGAKKIVLKGISPSQDQIGIVTLNVENREKNYYFTQKMPVTCHGTGDCFASAFTGAYMNGNDLADSAAVATDFVLECIKKTMDDPAHWYGVKFEKALPYLMSRVHGKDK